MAELREGAILKSVNGATIRVEKLLGDGGQGYVYKVSYNGKPKALKWYKPEKVKNLKWFYNNIQKNIESGSPSPQFLWPEDLTNWEGNTFGYIMGLRPDDYKDFPDFLLAKEKFTVFSSMIDAAINIVCGFRSLHKKGFTYQDLNDGNFFIRPSDGAVLICDNDNVAESGENSGIKGKPRYMAPVVVTGAEKPDKFTDRFSLAVILFLLFTNNHPLEGKKVEKQGCATEMEQYNVYGKNPVFIADPDDDSNRPLVGINRNFQIRWPLLNNAMRSLFVQAFSKKAMTEVRSSSLPIEMIWCRTLLQYRSDLVGCPHCRNQTVLEHDKPICTKCKKDITPIGYLSVEHYEIPIIAGSVLSQEHLNDFAKEEYSTKVIGEIIVAKNNSNVFGLKNMSDYEWRYQNGNETKIVKKGEAVQLIKNRQIKIDNHIITVK